ncbi:MAG TPA: carboxypeptidase-like regulatory domain-containing protein, partial [Anseongella sp.]|nr:carboxypeptidase-like regulatory domain-containing protein [Anseongella sp.]
MKLTIGLLIATCLHMSAAAFSQRLSLSEKNVPLVKVLREIKKQSGYQLLYNTETLHKAGSGPVSIDVKDMPLEEVLQLVFKGQPLQYELLERTILVKARPALKAGTGVPLADTLRGRVTDTTGAPLPGVSVRVTGSGRGAATDMDGVFLIEAEADDMLEVSFIG